MRKPGDIEMVFGNPLTNAFPVGQARLHKLLREQQTVELWLVEYLDQEEHLYEAFIKKQDDGKNQIHQQDNTHE